MTLNLGVFEIIGIGLPCVILNHKTYLLGLIQAIFSFPTGI